MHKIFIGLILIFLDFNLDLNTTRIGLIPDFLGYISLLQGIKEMKGKSPYFSKIFPITNFALFFSIVIYFLDLIGLSLNPPNSFFAVVLGIAGIILSLYISYNIVQGVLDMQKNTGPNLNGYNLYIAWKLLAAFSILVYPMIFIPGLNIIFIILALVFNIYFLYQFNVTKITYQKSI